MKKLLIISLIFVLTISMLAILISCDKKDDVYKDIPIEEYDGTPLVKIVYMSFDGWGVGDIRTLSFESNNITNKIINPYSDPNNTAEEEVMATFTDEDEKYMVDRFYTYGLFDLKEEYNDNEPVCDGGSWCLTIYFEDGTIKESKGGMLCPQEVFSNSAIAIYDKIHYQYWGVPEGYRVPPSADLDVISNYENGNNRGGTTTGSGAYYYKYHWHTTDVDNGDLYEFASSLRKTTFQHKGEYSHNYLLIRTINSYSYYDANYKENFSRCVVKEYDNTSELTNEKVLLDCGWIGGRDSRQVDIQENKIYSIELTFSNNQYSIQVFRT